MKIKKSKEYKKVWNRKKFSRSFKFQDYKICFKAFQIETKINQLEKSEVNRASP